MRRKLGLLADLDLEEQDQELVEGLLKTMHETGESVGCLLSNSMHDRLCSAWTIWHLLACRQLCGPSKYMLSQQNMQAVLILKLAASAGADFTNTFRRLAEVPMPAASTSGEACKALLVRLLSFC